MIIAKLAMGGVERPKVHGGFIFGAFEDAQGDHGLDGGLRGIHGPQVQEIQWRDGSTSPALRLDDKTTGHARDTPDFKDLNVAAPHGLALKFFVHVHGFKMRRFAVIEFANVDFK